MSASPFTSQGYPFSKDLASYDAESLGRAFFADGLVTDFGGPRLFDNARLTVKANPPRHAPLVYAGREVAVYVYTGDQEAEITDKYARLVLKPHEAGIFAWRREGLVTFRIKLGSSLLALARVPSAAAMSQLRAVRTEAALNGQAWTASWLLGLFALDGKPLLDPLNVMTLDELAKSANPIISRHEQPTYLRGGILLRYKEGAIDVVVGLFFDGTGNNRYCTELIYNELLDIFSGRVSDDKVKEMKRKDDVDHPVFGSARLVKRKDYMLEEDTSYFTPYSNVVLLHDLYQTRAYDPLRPTLPVTLRHYVQGIGTHVELDADGIPTPDGYEEDDKLGRATGRGPNGVVARVEEVLALVGAQVQRLMQVHNVAVRTLRFDLFGFSRGAAAARFCANELTRPANAKQERPAHGYLGKWLTDANVPLPAAVEVRFVGLFDTVVSDSTADGVADKYKVLLPLLFTEPGNVLYNDWHTQSEALGLGKSEPLYTSLKRVTGKVMHIVAKDEYRVRFPLTVSDAPHNYNLYLHGAHSDIGGGYAEMPAEAVVRFADVSVADTAADLAALNATAGSYRVRYTRRFVGGKWVADATPKGSPERRRITVEKSDEHRTMANPGISTGPSMPAVKLSDHYLVINNGFISNKLALVAFNALLQYALLQKLPFEPDLKKAKVKRPEFYTPPQQTPYFTAYYEAIEKMVKNPVAETTTFPPEVSFPLYEHFVHSSANYNQSIALRERAGETSAALGLYANEPRVITVVDPKTRERKDIMQRQYLQPADHEE